MTISSSIITRIISFLKSFLEFYRNRPNIRITIDFDSQEAIQGNSVYKYVRYKYIKLTFTNIGYMSAELEKIRVIISGKDVTLQRSPYYEQSSYYYYYHSEGETLGRLDSHKKYIITVRRELFSKQIDDIYIMDTVGKKWSIDKEDLDKFKKEYVKCLSKNEEIGIFRTD